MKLVNNLVLLCLVLFKISVFSQECGSIQDLFVKFEGQTSWSTTRVTGCFQDQSFGGEPPKQLYVTCTRKNRLTQLDKSAFSGLAELHKIQFFDCKIDVIQTEVFVNVTSLRGVRITNGELTEVHTRVFDLIPSLVYIYLEQHKISFIEDLAFANLPYLHEVSLRHNLLDTWKKEWVTNSTNLETINLSHNRLTQVTPRMFDTLPNMKSIDLSYNNITVIHPNAFEGLTYLRKLDLHHNRLSTISPKIFGGNLHISEFRLSANYLNYLSHDFLVALKVKFFFLLGNPIKCGCLDSINLFLQEKAVQVDPIEFGDEEACRSADIPVCVIPSSFSNTCVEKADQEVTDKFFNYIRKIVDKVPEKCVNFS